MIFVAKFTPTIAQIQNSYFVSTLQVKFLACLFLNHLLQVRTQSVCLQDSWPVITLKGLKRYMARILLTPSIAAFIVLYEYPIFSNNPFNFKNCSPGLEQILTILRHSEKGTLFLHDGGWHEVGRR
jgi:hypothetical protein